MLGLFRPPTFTGYEQCSPNLNHPLKHFEIFPHFPEFQIKKKKAGPIYIDIIVKGELRSEFLITQPYREGKERLHIRKVMKPFIGNFRRFRTFCLFPSLAFPYTQSLYSVLTSIFHFHQLNIFFSIRISLTFMSVLEPFIYILLKMYLFNFY